MIALLLSLMVARAHAWSLESETTAGANTLQETLTFDTQHKEKGADDSNVTLNGQITFGGSSDSSVQPPTPTRNIGAELNGLYSFPSDLQLGVGASGTLTTITAQSSTSGSQRFTNGGLNGLVGYTWYFGAPGVSPFELKSTDGFQYYSLNRVGGIKITQALARELPNIMQFALNLEATLNPWDWFSAKVAYTYELYNKDVADFVSNLDALSGLTRSSSASAALSGLSSVTSGLPQNLSEVTLTFRPIQTWELEVAGNGTVSASDESFSYGVKLSVSKEFASWKVGLGVERDISLTAVQSQGIVMLGYSI